MKKTALASALLCIAVVGCKKKGAGDIKTVCEANFAHGEKDDGKWSPGKGDKAKFMDYCLKQKPDVVHCSSMEIDFGDKSCEKVTGVGTDGFEVKMEIAKLRDGVADAPPPAPAPAPTPTEPATDTAKAPVPPPAPAADGPCTGEEVVLPGPKITVCVPGGYVKPLNTKPAKDKTGGQLDVSYSGDGTIGGSFVATFNITYNGKSSSAPDFKYLEDNAKEYCDTPPTMVDIMDGKGKYFACASKSLGHVLAASKIFTDKNLIDCSSQSDNKPDVESVCRTLKQQ